MSVIKNSMWILGRTRVTTNFKKTLTSRRFNTTAAKPASDSTIDQRDVNHHSKMVREWWCEEGPMKALHSYNLIRVPFIRDGLLNPSCAHTLLPLRGKKVLDVGCGGGILSEPLARLGANVTGIDASDVLIETAREHSNSNQILDFNRPKYICTSIEDHAQSHPKEYDGIVCSEIIEHVADKELFVKSCVDALKLNGRIFFTTPNRTKLSQFGVIFLAENIFNLVPKGTHQIEKFIKPNELQFLLERNKCFVELTHGVMYNPLTNRWSWSNTHAFAYVLQAVKITI